MLDLLFKLALATLAGAAVGYAIAYVIDEKQVKKKAKEVNSDAFKLLIKEKKKNAVKVGIFDLYDEHLQDCEITSDKGASDELRVGQVIYV